MDFEKVVELKTQGNEAFKLEDWMRAKEIYSEALAAAEKLGVDSSLLGSLWSNRSATFAAQEDYESALADAENAISVRKDWPRGYARKAVALFGKNETEDAAKAITQGLDVDPSDEMLLKLKDHQEELETEDLKRKSPDDSTALSDALEQIKAASVTGALPVVVLSGFLGSGKTTLLNHLLTEQDSKTRIALLVNDMAEVNIDAELIRNSHEVTETAEELIELTNGCVCCTLRGDLIKAATRIICAKKFDIIVIEATGISEPMPVAATFTAEDFHGASLRKFFNIDNMVTVIDCSRFLDELEQGESLQKRNLAAYEDDERNISHLLIDQVEFANTILLNKCDLVSKDRIKQIRKLVQEINPNGCIMESINSKVDIGQILNTERFTIEWADGIEGFKTELTNPHTSETEEYGIGSVVFRSRIPFHPKRLHAFFFGKNGEPGDERIVPESPLQEVYRSKGVFYLASSSKLKLSWSTAGKNVEFQNMYHWLGPMIPKDLWPLDDADWDPEWGDREQKIVLIGNSAHLKKILPILEKCLLNEQEQSLDEDIWSKMDPQNLWGLAEDSEEEEEEDSDEEEGSDEE